MTAPATTTVISAEQCITLGQALADAIEHRTPEGFCAECETRPEGLCNDHAADLDLTDAYLTLGRELGIRCPCGESTEGGCPGSWHGCDWHDEGEEDR